MRILPPTLTLPEASHTVGEPPPSLASVPEMLPLHPCLVKVQSPYFTEDISQSSESHCL